MNFKRSDHGSGKKVTRFVDICTNEQNSLTRASLIELTKILEENAGRPKIRVARVHIGKSGNFFPTDSTRQMSHRCLTKNSPKKWAKLFFFFNHLLRFDKPVIAEVTGYAMGGGAVITVGSQKYFSKYMLEGKARISFSEVLVGLPLPGNFIDKIARTVYPPFVNSVCAAENYKAGEAKAIGLIDETAADIESLRKLTLKKLDYLNRIPLSALQRTKQAINAPILERSENDAQAYL